MSAEGTIVNGTTVLFSHPELEGFRCEVQHSVQSNKPRTDQLGTIGIGVVTLPTGQPRLILQVKHADTDSLATILRHADAMTLVEILIDKMAEAQAIADASDVAVRQ
jgi:hypothetical protein